MTPSEPQSEFKPCLCKCCSQACRCNSCTEQVPRQNAELAEKDKEIEEQARLLGAGGSRELALKAKVAELEKEALELVSMVGPQDQTIDEQNKEIARLREALDHVIGCPAMCEFHFCDECNSAVRLRDEALSSASEANGEVK